MKLTDSTSNTGNEFRGSVPLNELFERYSSESRIIAVAHEGGIDPLSRLLNNEIVLIMVH